jgi:hypothetical protein
MDLFSHQCSTLEKTHAAGHFSNVDRETTVLVTMLTVVAAPRFQKLSRSLKGL